MARRGLKRTKRTSGRRVYKRRKLHRKNNSMVSTIVYARSLRTRQPFPDRYFAWFTLENTGVIPASTGSNMIYGLCLNNAVEPLNAYGGAGGAWPGAIGAESTSNPACLKQFLYFSGSNALYFFGRVWSVKIAVTVQPQNAADNCTVVCAPVSGGDEYSNVSLIGQAPQSKMITVTQPGPPKQNTVRHSYYLPSLMGIPKREYSASTANTQFSSSAAPSLPWYHQTFISTQSQSTNSGKIGWTILAKYLIEFFDHCDTELSA